MNLLQTLNEAAAKKSIDVAKALLADKDAIAALTKKAVSHLKSTFGKDVADQKMAVITQHVRSAVDAALLAQSKRLNKDGLEDVVHAVINHLKDTADEHKLFEDEDMPDDEESLEESELNEPVKKIEAYGVKGMKSTPWRKVFKDQAALEKWLDKNDGDYDVHGTRDIDESAVEEAAAPGQEATTDEVFQSILDGAIEVDDVMYHPSGKAQIAAAKIIQKWYDECAGPNKDDANIFLSVMERIEDEYGDDYSPE